MLPRLIWEKLDVIQRIASRIITDATPQSHSAPLQLLLGLDSLSSRRCNRLTSLINDISLGKIHPYYKEFFSAVRMEDSGAIRGKKLDTRRFSVYGRTIYNEITSSHGASNSLVESVLWGHLSTRTSSQLPSTAISLSSLIQSTSPPESPGRISP